MLRRGRLWTAALLVTAAATASGVSGGAQGAQSQQAIDALRTLNPDPDCAPHLKADACGTLDRCNAGKQTIRELQEAVVAAADETQPGKRVVLRQVARNEQKDFAKWVEAADTQCGCAKSLLGDGTWQLVFKLTKAEPKKCTR